MNSENRHYKAESNCCGFRLLIFILYCLVMSWHSQRQDKLRRMIDYPSTTIQWNKFLESDWKSKGIDPSVNPKTNPCVCMFSVSFVNILIDHPSQFWRQFVTYVANIDCWMWMWMFCSASTQWIKGRKAREHPLS